MQIDFYYFVNIWNIVDLNYNHYRFIQEEIYSSMNIYRHKTDLLNPQIIYIYIFVFEIEINSRPLDRAVLRFAYHFTI